MAAYKRTYGRSRKIEELQCIRMKKGIDSEGMRDMMCFVYYNTLLYEKVDPDSALELTDAFNQRFDCPLEMALLHDYLSTSIKKKGYILKNKWVVEALNLTHEEQVLTGLYPHGSRQYERLKSRTEKKERDALIRKLHYSGKTQVEIAKLVCCSQPTVSRIIGKIKKVGSKIHWQVKNILKQKAVEKPGQMGGISTQSVSGAIIKKNFIQVDVTSDPDPLIRLFILALYNYTLYRDGP